ncbi:hypothetical protein EKD04_021225 [Chloroflexales bacterium ZM16-3]|nr:hypothetical protein [Chloroflexales bacterium ZM16-3]
MGDVILIERAGALGQHDLGAVGQAGDDDAGGVAPEDVHTDLHLARGLGVASGRRMVMAGRVLSSGVAALLDAELAVGVARRLAGLVEPALRDELLRVVLLDPGEDGLGIAGDDIAEGGLLVGRKGRLEQVDAGGEQELEGRVGEVAQHRAELAARGDAGRHVEAVGRGRVGDTGEAEPVDQGRVLDQVRPQVAHEALVLLELDQVGGGKGDARLGRRAGVGPVGGALGELAPGQVAEQGAVLLDDRVVRDPGRQHGVGLGQRTGGFGHGGRRGRRGPQVGDEPVDDLAKRGYHRGTPDRGGVVCCNPILPHLEYL